MAYIIDDSEWRICKICKKSVKEFAKKYGGTGKYYSEVFEKHLINDHNSNLLDYFINICQLDRPVCACSNSECEKPCRIFRAHKDISWTEYGCGANPGVIKWSEKAKEERKGIGNPMYGKKPWNKNKTWSQAAKDKMRQSALKRINEGRLKTTRTLPHYEDINAWRSRITNFGPN